jgi:hypothetical protein
MAVHPFFIKKIAMKQLLLAIGLVVSISGVCAQQVSTTSTRLNSQPPKKESVFLNDISMRAARDFEKKFGKVADKQWYKAGDGYVVKFTISSILHRSVYNSRGIWIYTIKYYNESIMPRAVRAQVKGTYYDCTITQVEEIEQPDGPVIYMVHMYDATTWKNVRLWDGEMEVVEEFDKG